MKRAAVVAASLAGSLLLGGCQGSGALGVPGDAASATPPIDAALPVDEAVAPDLASPRDLFMLNPVSLCPVATMDRTYSGPLPPNPYGTIEAADRCLSAAHDVIIVLGCPNNADGTPSSCQTKRADDAVAFMNAGYGDRFITSGGAVHNTYVEADTLEQLLIARGVPAAHVFKDTSARHTDENIYYSTRIMQAHGWTDAIVITDDPGQLVFTALCDSNCCVNLGRLTLLAFSVGGATQKQGHYVRYPWAAPVAAAECTTIEAPLKFMCVNLASRFACAGRLQLPDGGM